MLGIRIEQARPEQRTLMLDFLLDTFRIDEPLFRHLLVGKAEAKPYLTDLLDDSLRQPVSFTVQNDERKIVGCCLAEVLGPGPPRRPLTSGGQPQPQQQQPPSQHHEDLYAENVHKIDHFVRSIRDQHEHRLLSAKEPQKHVRLTLVAVHPDYQRCGLAKKLIETCLQKSIELQCRSMHTVATSHRFQQLLQLKFDFHPEQVVHHVDYRHGVAEHPLFDLDDEATKCAALMYRKLP